MTSPVPGPVSMATRSAPRAVTSGRSLPLVVLCLVLAGLVSLIVNHLIARERALQAGRLQAIARLKAESVADWLDERHEDAHIIQGSIALRQLQIAARTAGDPVVLAQLHDRLRDFLRDDAYETVQLVDAECELIAKAGTGYAITPALRAAVRKAIADGRATTVDLAPRADAAAPLHLDFVVPVLAHEAGASAAVVLHMDPGRVLFPRVQRWPYPSASAEALLIRREGDTARYLNDLRFQPAAGMTLTVPVAEKQQVAAQLAIDPGYQRRLLDGVDYRGKRVLGVGLAVPGTDWYLLAKMDRAEVYAPVWREAGWLVAVMALGVLSLVFATNYLRQRQTLESSQAAALRLEEEAQRRNVMFGQSRDGMIVIGRDGRVHEANQSFADMHGYALEEVAGLNVWDWQGTLTKEEVLARLALDPATSRLFETRHRRRDGTVFDVEISYNPMHWGRHVYVFCVVRDITDRKAIETWQRQNEDRLKYAMAGANDGLWDWNLLTNAVYYSPRWKSMLGYGPGELEDTLETWNRLVEPEQRDIVLALAADAIAGRAAKYECEYRLRHRDGHYIDVLSRAMVVRDAEGRPLRMVGTHADVTERKRDEARLQAANENLRRSMADLQRHEEELTLIARLNDLLQACSTAQEAYRVIALTLSEFRTMGDGSLAVTAPDHGSVEVVAEWGAGTLSQSEFGFDECRALRFGQVHVVQDPARDVACEHETRRPGRGYICVPLIVKGETLGLVTCACPGPAPEGSGRDPQRLILTVSEVLKLSLSNLRLRESLRVQATHDPLTGLFNRGYLDDILPRELQRADRREAEVCVAMIDLDHFKNFNDTHGHEAGDLLLREFGTLLQRQLRKSDIACRYGGEEFVVILVDTPLDAAWHRLDDIRRDCQHMQLTLEGNPLPPVTVSIGMAESPSHGRDTQALLRAADAALYAAKGRGRNQVLRFTDV